MAFSNSTPEFVYPPDLANWKVINSGGFGKIYKARHLKWCFDVAIKLLYYDDGNGTSLLREVRMMRQGSSPYVIPVLGVFQGQPPSSRSPTSLGLVMEFMERGSLHFMQKCLQKTPPWPLVFRLAHQIALGINFLHSRKPVLLHLDLKPNNVLLDNFLNAKLTDFGLAKIDSSRSGASATFSENEAGTISYMPPEAFRNSYTPSRGTDIYSYGILLWSILTGKQPYEGVIPAIVRFRIPKGDRPSLVEIDRHDGPAEVADLKELMMRCWVDLTEQRQRPSSHECTTRTERLFEKHKHDINDAVHEVLTTLKEKETTAQSQTVPFTQATASSRVESRVCNDNVKTGPMPVQEMAAGRPGNRLDVRDSPPSQPPSSSRKPPVTASSVEPIHSTAKSGKFPRDSPENSRPHDRPPINCMIPPKKPVSGKQGLGGAAEPSETIPGEEKRDAGGQEVLDAIANLRTEVTEMKKDICNTLRGGFTALRAENNASISALERQGAVQNEKLEEVADTAATTSNSVAELEGKVKLLTSQFEQLTEKRVDLEGGSKSAPRTHPEDDAPPRRRTAQVNACHSLDKRLRKVASKTKMTFGGDRIQTFRAELKGKVKLLKSQFEQLTEKRVDLEGRSKRMNIRIAGVKEGSESGKRMSDFVAQLLKTTLDLEETPLLDRAHRAPCTRPEDDAPSRCIVAQVHDSRSLDEILRKVASKKKMMFGGDRIQIFRDFPQTVAKCCAAFSPAWNLRRDKPRVKYDPL